MTNVSLMFMFRLLVHHESKTPMQSFCDNVGNRRSILIIFHACILRETANEAEKTTTMPQICCIHTLTIADRDLIEMTSMIIKRPHSFN